MSDAEQIRWQRNAASLLGRLLEMAAKQGLPPVNWTVHSAGSALHGECTAHPLSVRRGHFTAWRDAITTASGHSPDYDHKHEFSRGETLLTAGWRRIPLDLGRRSERLYPAVHVTLSASIWPEDPEEDPDA